MPRRALYTLRPIIAHAHARTTRTRNMAAGAYTPNIKEALALMKEKLVGRLEVRRVGFQLPLQVHPEGG